MVSSPQKKNSCEVSLVLHPIPALSKPGNALFQARTRPCVFSLLFILFTYCILFNVFLPDRKVRAGRANALEKGSRASPPFLRGFCLQAKASTVKLSRFKKYLMLLCSTHSNLRMFFHKLHHYIIQMALSDSLPSSVLCSTEARLRIRHRTTSFKQGSAFCSRAPLEQEQRFIQKLRPRRQSLHPCSAAPTNEELCILPCFSPRPTVLHAARKSGEVKCDHNPIKRCIHIV